MAGTTGKALYKRSLVNVLGVVYVHTKSSDGGDLYLTRFAEPYHEHLDTRNWYEKRWFDRQRVRLLGTSSVYRVPTRSVGGTSLDLVVKNCRVGEDVPLNTHTLQEFCDAEFNSPWEEFSLVMEMREGAYGPGDLRLGTQHPLAIYVPPESMQLWQSGRSRSRINRIRARHPGIDIDILKQYKLVYGWIRGKNLIEVFEGIDAEMPEMVHHLQALTRKVVDDMTLKGYYMADMKPEHVILGEEEVSFIEEAGSDGRGRGPGRQTDLVHELVRDGRYSVIDYELLFRTPVHDDRVKYSRRHSYLDDQRDRMKPVPLPSHLSSDEIFGVPYVHGNAESTGGHLWVVGRNARLFDYFLPERWRKTPSLSLSENNEVFYTVTKDNIHLVWKTSRVGEFPGELRDQEEVSMVSRYGINSPFEEFAIAAELGALGIKCVYARAVYMTGSAKVERSNDMRKFESHRHITDAEGAPVLREERNYITIRGYYNGPDKWVPEHEDALYSPLDLGKARIKGLIGEDKCGDLLRRTVERLREAGYDGSLLKPIDLLIVLDGGGDIVRDADGEPDVIICDFELIWRVPTDS
jgi:hypothetical protein